MGKALLPTSISVVPRKCHPRAHPSRRRAARANVTIPSTSPKHGYAITAPPTHPPRVLLTGSRAPTCPCLTGRTMESPSGQLPRAVILRDSEPPEDSWTCRGMRCEASIPPSATATRTQVLLAAAERPIQPMVQAALRLPPHLCPPNSPPTAARQDTRRAGIAHRRSTGDPPR
jgi:hypothetical protein